MRKYYLGAKEITKDEWSKDFKKYPRASVILRIDKLPEIYKGPKVDEVISAEKAKLIRKKLLY